MTILDLTFASGERSLSVRRFSVKESISSLFSASVWARSASPDIDLESIVGKPAALTATSGLAFAAFGGVRRWSGVCSYFEQIQAEPTGLSTYFLRIVPSLWLLGQRRDYRVFQHLAIPDIVDSVLARWSVNHTWDLLDRARYFKLEYKVQYGETDGAFVARLLEEAGIAFTFPDGETMAMSDKLHMGAPRIAPPIHYVDNPNAAGEIEYVTQVRLSHEVRPGAYTIRDYDFRNPSFALFGEAKKADPPESIYEQYQYWPGGSIAETGAAGDTPVADDKGFARYDQRHLAERASAALLGERAGRRGVAFDSNATDLKPGVVFSMALHPHVELNPAALLLVSDAIFEGSPDGEWVVSCQAVFTDVVYRPLLRAKKPRAEGVQSAVVVGRSGQEIDTDEFGRVRVQFPWDREGKKDENSSCWVRVSHGWAGAGFGMITTPRIGHEVLVGFLGGDPDDPIIVGRVFNATNPVPYKLPEHKTRSTWKSDSSIGSGGFNELLFEDLKGSELVYVQAQKNLRRLVKNDETITVVNDRRKLVKGNEIETTNQNRTEVVGQSRVEITDQNRTTVIGGTYQKLVKQDEIERTEKDHVVFVGRDQHITVQGTRRELIEGNSQLGVKGSRNEAIDGGQSLSVGGDQHEKIGGCHLAEAASDIHYKAGGCIVLEAPDITIKAPGGFVRVDAGGVTIVGSIVRINSGGSAGSAPDAKPGGPEEPREAKIDEPNKPEVDDVSVTGLKQ